MWRDRVEGWIGGLWRDDQWTLSTMEELLRDCCSFSLILTANTPFALSPLLSDGAPSFLKSDCTLFNRVPRQELSFSSSCNEDGNNNNIVSSLYNNIICKNFLLPHYLNTTRNSGPPVQAKISRLGIISDNSVLIGRWRPVMEKSKMLINLC